MARSLAQQAEELHRSFSALLRHYQFRDREEVQWHGVSTSQCHTLAMLRAEGPQTMGDVAGALNLELSTVTRLADQLEDKGMIKRERSSVDRRVCMLRITRKGSGLARSIEDKVVAEHRAVLSEIPTASREAVINTIQRLESAFKQRGNSKG